MKSLLASRRILQAPMAGAQGHELAVAVHNSGLGIGAIPCAMLSTDQILHEVAEFKRLTNQTNSKPLLLNLNFFCHAPLTPTKQEQDVWKKTLEPYYREMGIDLNKPQKTSPPRRPFGDEHLEVLKTVRPLIVSFHFGLPSVAHCEAIKRDVGSFIISSATTVEEAKWLAERGVDAIIAQGFEAGGHRGMFLSNDLSTQVGTFALVPQITNLKLPIIAAGGIGDARGIQAAFALGASACQLGTIFLLTKEAKTSQAYRKALRDPSLTTTALTNVFTGRPARGIVNKLVREIGPMSPKAPVFPFASEAVFPLRMQAESQGSFDFTSCWSGQNRMRLTERQGTNGVEQEESALDIVKELSAAAFGAGGPSSRL